MTPNPLVPGESSLKRNVVWYVGAAAVVLAVLTVFVPVVGDQIAATIGLVVGSQILVVLVALVGGAYGLVQLYRSGTSPNAAPPLAGFEPERAHYAEHAITGDDIDESVAAIGSELPESDAKNWWTYREKSDVQSSLRNVTVRVLAGEHDVSRDAAERMVADGSWTRDRRAAAFLGDEDAPALPLRVQFVDWLSGEAYQRRVDATVDALARHAGVAPTEPAPESGTGSDDDVGDPGPSRTADGSALPVHELTEDERYDEALDDPAGHASSRPADHEPTTETGADRQSTSSSEQMASHDAYGRSGWRSEDAGATANDAVVERERVAETDGRGTQGGDDR